MQTTNRNGRTEFSGDTFDGGLESQQMKQEVATAISRFQEKSKTLPPREEGDKSGLAHISWAPGCTEDVLLMLARDGAVIVENAISPDTCDRIKQEMQPYHSASEHCKDRFLGKNTKRLGALIARSQSSWDACAHPLLMQVCNAVLGEQCMHSTVLRTDKGLSPGYHTHPWHLDLTQIIDIGTGNPSQPMHRDRWAYIFDFESIEPRISTMWAIDEFTFENGATRVVPGSHLWPRGRLFDKQKDTVAYAAMPKGSVLIWTGSAWHSGGHNQSANNRWGLNIDYSVAWLRQEENQYLSVPPSVAKKLPQHVAKLCGYQLGGYALGYYADFQHPEDVLSSTASEQRINWATDETLWPPVDSRVASGHPSSKL